MFFCLSILLDEFLLFEFENIVLLLRNCYYFRNVYGKCLGFIVINGKNCILWIFFMILFSVI